MDVNQDLFSAITAHEKTIQWFLNLTRQES